MKQKLRFWGIFICFGFFLNFAAAQSVFINEIHYDNDGGDTGEAVEVAGPAGTDLTGWSIVLYNGSDSETYGEIALGGTIPDLQGGYGTLEFSDGSIQNGSPDGLALVDNDGNVIQFLSYEGTITALDGPASGLESEDIGVQENSSTQVGFSLQLGGEGQEYTAFTWQEALENTFGAINANQDFGGEVTDPDPDPEPEPEP
ncbi:lamin tail domain-containing protein, partial [Zunongwangia sp. F363]